MRTTDLPPPLADWFAAKGWAPRRHQLDDARRGARRAARAARRADRGGQDAGRVPADLVELIERPAEGLHTLYVSPLKALAVDVQRNLLTPIDEMGLDIRVETRTGDTPSDRKARQRVKPPQMLLTTPESLSLLLSYPDSGRLFAGLRTIVIDEVHAFATGKRGDLLSLCLARLQTLAPAMRRVALSATVADPDGYRGWLSPDGDIDAVALVQGEAGADAEIAILLPEGRVPWSGHSGRYAAAQVMAEIEAHRTTLVFCNTRSLAELIFQDLWKENEQAAADRHPPRIAEPRGAAQGRRGDGRRQAARARRDRQPRSRRRLGRRRSRHPDGRAEGFVAAAPADRARQPPARRSRAEAVLVPGNRFEYLEARAALDAVEAGELDPDIFRPGALDVLAQHIMAVRLRRAVRRRRDCSRRYAGLRLMRRCPTRCSSACSGSSDRAAMR